MLPPEITASVMLVIVFVTSVPVPAPATDTEPVALREKAAATPRAAMVRERASVSVARLSGQALMTSP